MTDLKLLKLGYNERLGGPGLALLKHAPLLEYLDIGWCRLLEDAAIEPCKTMSALEHVNLSHTRVTDEALRNFRDLPALRSLD